MTANKGIAPWGELWWLERATEWIEAELARLGIAVTGPPTQPHVRPWSTVLCVPTGETNVYFKACSPALAHEIAITQAMGRWCPHYLPAILAADSERGWMLMADGGSTVREYTKADGDIRHWLKLMPHYAALQIELTTHVDDLIALGLPDRRLAALPDRIAELLTQTESLLIGQENGLTCAEHKRLLAMEPVMISLCERLAAFDIPESVHHGDFHDANVFANGERFAFFDWGDASAAHPFVSLRTAFVSLEFTLELEEGRSPEFDRLRDAYLEPWSEYGAPEDLLAAFDLAQRLSPLCSALSWHRVISSLPRAGRTEYAHAVPGLLKEFLERHDASGDS